MAYIDNASVAQIRKELKEAFPKFKFGVRKNHYTSVTVTIKAGPRDFSDLFTDEYSQRKKYIQVNPYHVEKFYPGHSEFLSKIVNIVKTAPARADGYHKDRGHYDNSDAMTDYFDTAYYFDINIGSWDRPYEVK